MPNTPSQEDFDELKRSHESLKSTVQQLQAKVDSLTSNTDLPVELEHALVDRGFIRFEPVGYPILNGDTTLFQVPGQGFRENIADVSIVPAIPIRYLKVPKNVSGTIGDMYIPLYIFADTSAD